MGSLMFDGKIKDIPNDSCNEENHGLGGLCGVSENQEVHEHARTKRRELISTFKSANPLKVVADDLPYICFEDPYSATWIIRNCWIAGVLLVLCALAVTWSEVMQRCQEV